MAKTREKKEKEVVKLADNFAKAKSIIFTSFDGLAVVESRQLRSNLRKEKVNYQVSKKTLLYKALKDAKLEDVNLKELRGNIGVAFGLEDEIAPAKLLVKFASTHEQLKIQEGFLNGRIIGAEKVMALAKLPGKQELIAMVVGTIKAPLNGLVNVLSGNIRGLVTVLKALEEKKK